MSFTDDVGDYRLGVVDDDFVVDVTSRLGDQVSRGTVSPMRALLAKDVPLADVIGDLDGQRLPLASVRFASIVPDPPKIIAAPVNYRDHQAEMQEDFHIDALGIFLKATSSVLGSGGVVRLPYTDRRFDQEGELAVVIGRPASHVSIDDALNYVAGYTTLLDMTMRGGEDRSTRKSFDSFTPVGPYLVTPDEAGPPENMRLRTWVNGELRQDADVRDLIWDVPRLISYASSVMSLQPGDIITTGTPAGIGQVSDGDQVAVEITNLGRLEVAVTSEGAVSCPTRGAARGPKPPENVTPIRAR
ncbi:fumarylacetoacetate hydrolase family protein [Agromyces salentinus]|uniref:fumarylacetoacetate hydrolase family protein n=1 Tax=Agromyces salentinus TaxID=269421 RepID=UPI001FE2F4FC|nr:fumarylacetoacetate hydrolase family protein [Agromyces salentinus]